MFGRYPTVRSAGFPSLKMITVGIDMIPSCIGTPGFSSMSIFMTLILSPSSPWICSTIGAIIRHGPHHVAQKSTSTGLSAFRTAVSKSLSVTSSMFATCTPSLKTQSPESDFDSVFDSALDSGLDSDLVSALMSDFLSGLGEAPLPDDSLPADSLPDDSLPAAL